MPIKPFKLERYYSLHEFSATYSLCNSDCESMTIRELLALEEGATDRFHNLWLGYTETKGHASLRHDISNIYESLLPENILVCTGAQEPIYLFDIALLEAGDEVIVQTPCYQSLHTIPETLGCEVLPWHVKYENNIPHFDIDELEELASNKTKAIFINTPHNPTGFHFTQEDQNRLIEIARSKNIMIFCDEVYHNLEHSPEFAIPAMADAYENGISVGVMSKAYGLPGLRIGWISSKNKSILEQVALHKEYTTICNAAPSEFLAGIALRNQKFILDKNLQIIKDNLNLYDAFFEKQKHLFSWHKPSAGPIGLVKMLFDSNDKDFAERVLKEKKVLLLPGGIYDFEGYFRIGFGRKKIKEGLEQFEEYINASF